MNGLAERMVQTFKKGVQYFEGMRNGTEIQTKLDQFLFKYRVTPNSTTGISPSEIMFGRQVRTLFDLLRPSEQIADKVVQKQLEMKKYYNSHSPRQLDLTMNEKVKIRNFGKGPKWKDATILRRTGAVTYRCKVVPDDIIVKSHLNQIWPDRRVSESSSSSRSTYGHGTVSNGTLNRHDSSDSDDAHTGPSEPIMTRTGRVVRPPDRLNL